MLLCVGTTEAVEEEEEQLNRLRTILQPSITCSNRGKNNLRAKCQETVSRAVSIHFSVCDSALSFTLSMFVRLEITIGQIMKKDNYIS